MEETSQEYHYSDSDCGHAHGYILPKVEQILRNLGPERDIFDLGCGNGSVAAHLHGLGHTVTGVDPSEEGIRHANNSYPELDLHVGSAYDDLRGEYGQFDVTLSLEVVEHVYSPRKYANTVFDLTKPGGKVVISTPYHGYLKSLAIALMGKWGRGHYDPLWKNGHIKIWTPDRLTTLLEEAGLKRENLYRVGRIPPLARSMVMVASRPRT